MKSIIVILLAVLAISAQAGERKCERKHRRSEPNWIIERQTTYQVRGVPTSRLIIGKREFDQYRTGEVFEKGRRVR